MWLSSVTVWLKHRLTVAIFPCKRGSRAEIYNLGRSPSYALLENFLPWSAQIQKVVKLLELFVILPDEHRRFSAPVSFFFGTLIIEYL